MPIGVYLHKKGYKRPPFSKKWKENIANASRGNKSRYKGENVGYWGLHRWLDKTLGRPLECQHCKTTKQSKRYEWANISGEYKRDTSDFIRLCIKCHKAFDKNNHTHINREIMMEKRKPEKDRDAQRL